MPRGLNLAHGLKCFMSRPFTTPDFRMEFMIASRSTSSSSSSSKRPVFAAARKVTTESDGAKDDANFMSSPVSWRLSLMKVEIMPK